MQVGYRLQVEHEIFALSGVSQKDAKIFLIL